jgi:glycosyltransferase involved in cell wall biosynthesis
MTRVCHLSSVHQHDDPRIFLRQCRTLAAYGYETHIVTPGAPEGVRDGVRFHPAGPRPRSRVERMTSAITAVYRVGRSVGADIYHFHDPELLPVGLLLAAEGRRVIMDAHEHVPEDILDKEWIHPALRGPVSRVYGVLEGAALAGISAVSAATPHIGAFYARRVKRVEVVPNYPLREEFGRISGDWSAKDRAVCFVGMGSELRCLREMVAAAQASRVKLLFAGSVYPPALLDECKAHAGWKYVEYLGQVSRAEVAQVLARSMAGLVVFRAIANHVNAQPNKLFEYMSAGIPLIASDFPVWRSIVDGSSCGVCVNPTDVMGIAEAMRRLVDNVDIAREMGRRGRRSVETEFNWEEGARPLLRLYQDLS